MTSKDKYNSHVALIMRYQDDCNWIAREFSMKYFGEIEFGMEDNWVAGDVGGVIMISDYFFDMENMVRALADKVSKKSLFEWYDQWTDPNNKIKINLKYWAMRKTPRMQAKDKMWKSDCCHAVATSKEGEEGTGYYTCDLCGEPCGISIGDQS